MMPRKVWLSGLVAAILVGAYALVGFVYAPRWAAAAFRDYVSHTLHLEPVLAGLRINPFALSVEARGLGVREPGGAPLVACDRLYVNASIASLWHLSPVLQEVSLEHPVVAAKLLADGRLNLSALAPPTPPDAQPNPPSQPPIALRLALLKVQSGELTFDDLGEKPALHARFAPIEFTLRDFSTRADTRNAFQLEAVGPEGAKFALAGQLEPQPFSVTGSASISGLAATTVSEFGADALPFELPAGSISLAVHYKVGQAATHVAGAQAFALDLALDRLELAALELRPKGDTSTSPVRLAHGLVEGGAASLAQRTASLGTVTLTGLDADAVLDKQGLSLMRLLGPPAAPAAPATHAPTAPATPAPSAWVVTLPHLVVHASSAHFVDRTAPAPAPFEIKAIELQADGYSTQPGGHVPLTVSATIGAAGQFSAQLDVQPDAPALKGTLALSDFDLRLLQPYLADRWRLDLQAGQTGIGGLLQVTPGATAAAPLRISFDGGGAVRGLRTTDRLERKDFIRWQKVSVDGLRYRSEPAQLHIHLLVLDAPYADLVIAPNGSTNISDVLASSASAAALDNGAVGEDSADAVFGEAGVPGAEATPATPTAAAPVVVPPVPAPPPAAKGSAKATAKANAKGKPGAPPGPNSGLPLALSIDSIEVSGASANFEDYSIKPNFVTGLQELKGTIKGLSSEPDSRATINLDGAVDKYAPTHIAGEINVLSAQSYANVTASFRNMELTSLSPYSGKFAGYQIERGKLSVDVTYLVQDRKLNAKHKILLTQLQLGDKVDSPDATSLPLKLVVALLKDGDGNIDLDIPVTGDLDDPKFRVGPIVWKMIVNLCRKVATAPFALLGKLFGGGDDLQFIDFAPGSADVDAPMQERIANLRKALKARGGLSLEIPLASDAGLDGAALLDAAWAQRLEAIAPAATRSNRAAYQRKLEKAYSDANGKPLPEAPAVAAMPAPAAAPAAGPATAAAPGADALREARIAALEAALKAKVTVDPAALEALGQSRARAIQDVLLQAGEIDPLRVFIVAPAPAQPHDGKVRVPLSMRT